MMQLKWMLLFLQQKSLQNNRGISIFYIGVNISLISFFYCTFVYEKTQERFDQS
jgi:hypothetical protein